MEQSLKIATKGNTDVIDITNMVQEVLQKSGIKSGIASVFVVGSTAGVTTLEYEPGLVKDLKQAFEKIAPVNQYYYHHEKWHDDNGSSHVKASILGPSLVIPFESNQLLLGTWQQIVLIDFDTNPRKREVIVSIMEK